MQIDVTFDAARGHFIATAPELNQAVAALSMSVLKQQVNSVLSYSPGLGPFPHGLGTTLSVPLSLFASSCRKAPPATWRPA